MKISAVYELQSFATAVIMGLFAGAAYDLARSVRRLGAPSFAADILMWAAVAAVCGKLWYRFQYGEIRWYAVCSVGAALVLYFSLISKPVFCAFSFAAEKIWRFLSIILKILLTPLNFLCKIVSIFKEKAKQKSLRKVEDKNDEEKAGF